VRNPRAGALDFRRRCSPAAAAAAPVALATVMREGRGSHGVDRVARRHYRDGIESLILRQRNLRAGRLAVRTDGRRRPRAHRP